jgi:hypothetical protein
MITFYDKKLSTTYYRFGGIDFQHVLQYKDNHQIFETVDCTWNVNNKQNDFSTTNTSYTEYSSASSSKLLKQWENRATICY